MSTDFSGMLNRSTPFAPTSEEEISRRLESSKIDQQESTDASPSIPPPETGTAVQEPQKATEPTEWAVYVPIRENPHRSDRPSAIEYEVRDIDGGRGAIVVYTSPVGLQVELGQHQPMVKVDIIELLRHIRGQVPVVVNPTLKDGIQKREPKEVGE